MKYGVVLPIWQLTVAEAESLATRAEALGLDGVFVPDHILAKPATTQHYGGHWPDPFALLAFLAGRTSRLATRSTIERSPRTIGSGPPSRPSMPSRMVSKTDCVSQV
jgi:alkanesulfonate monooxygenase SsuD/methylene tetrahydromethanopterin reductase-like flavin-dependent oxidoreductase (luciferase family)